MLQRHFLIVSIFFTAVSTNSFIKLSQIPTGFAQSASSSAPIASVLNRRARAKKTVQSLTEQFGKFEQKLQAYISAINTSIETHTVRTVCTTKTLPWNSMCNEYMKNLGWNALKDLNCYHEIIDGCVGKTGRDASFPNYIADLATAFYEEMKMIPNDEMPKVNNITFDYSSTWSESSDRSLACDAYEVSSYKIQHNWHIKAAFSSENKISSDREVERFYLDEHIRTDSKSGYLRAARMKIPYFPARHPRQDIENSTTSISRWKGAVRTSSFQVRDEALKVAKDDAYLYLLEGENILVGSNIAIVMLPLFLCLLPVGLTGRHLYSVVMLIIISDIFSALPVIIKGAELLSLSQTQFTAFSMRMTNGLRCDGCTLPAELGVVRCKLLLPASDYGWPFIYVGVGMMILGLTIEALAFFFYFNKRK